MRIEVFASIDGKFHLIEELNDGVFSEKMLGDGFYIEPKSNELFSPIEKGEISLLTETKHAVFITNENKINILIHVGLDTVSLKGKPFKIKVKKNQSINLNDKLMDIDFKMIKQNNLSSEVIFTVNDENNKVWKFQSVIKSKTDIKRGQRIGYFILDETKSKLNLNEYFASDDIYNEIGKQLNFLIGGNNNYSEVYNCMTRLRFKIIDKNKVDINAIKNFKKVQGINWSGDELQLIFGQDVYKYKDAIIKINNSTNFEVNKISREGIFRKGLSIISGIMVPILPALITAGLLMGIRSIFLQTGLMPEILYTLPDKDLGENQVMLWNAPVHWAILQVVSEVALKFIAILTGISAAKYFKGNIIIGATISLMIANPFLFAGGSTSHGFFGMEYILIKTGIDPDPRTNPAWWGLGAIKIMPYTVQIFPHIFAAVIAIKLDKWVKKWISPKVDLIFRPFIAISLTVASVFFIIGPLWYIMEQIIAGILYYIAKAPLGIGVGIYSAMWQVAVVFGVHLALGSMNSMQTLSAGVSYLGIGSSLSVWAQTGAVFAVALFSKSPVTKNQAYSTIPGGFLGITEPIVYGINVPKFRPFLAGVIAAFIGGAFGGILGVTGRVWSGMGIFEVIGFFSYPIYEHAPSDILSTQMNGIFYILACLVSFGSAILLCFLMNKEKHSEKYLINKTNKKLITILNLINPELLDHQKEIKELNNLITKEDLLKIKNIEKTLLSIEKLKVKLEVLELKNEKYINKLMSKGKKLISKNNYLQAEKIYNLLENNKYKQLIIKTQNEILQNEELLEISWISSFVNNNIKEINKRLDQLEVDKNIKETFKKQYYNDLNNLKIHYKLSEPKLIEKSIKEVILDLKKENRVQYAKK